MKYCLIGEKLGHSFSKIIHQKCGLDYSLNEVQKDDLKNFLTNCKFDGFNVTIPYKREVMKYLDGISDEAKGIGAVNVVKNENGRLYGFNTDYDGLAFACEQKGVNVCGKNVLVLGSGGASKTSVYYATKNGAKSITVVSRTGEVNYENVYKLLNTQVIINTTPVGMYPNSYDKIIDLTPFKNLESVVDFIYNPAKTRLLIDAEKLNLKCVDGLSILVEQALKAQDIWLNKTHALLDSVNMLNSIRQMTLNAVLIGMPSSGKSTLGIELAKALNKPFYDADEEFFKTYNVTPSDYILNYGESAFREKESEVIKELSKKTGAVIATGGGAIEREENLQNLKINGVIIYVKRNLDKLIIEGRPLSNSVGVNELFKRRKEKYESFCDVFVDNNGEIENAKKEILKSYETACNKWC